MYDAGYADHVAAMRSWLEANVVPVGRNGITGTTTRTTRCSTAMLAVENLLGASHALWAVNTEEDHHEQQAVCGAGFAR